MHMGEHKVSSAGAPAGQGSKPSGAGGGLGDEVSLFSGEPALPILLVSL